jgi:hypothetical protein
MELRFAILRQSRDTVPFSGDFPTILPDLWPPPPHAAREVADWFDRAEDGGGGGGRGEMARFSDGEMFPNGGRDWLYRMGQHDRNFVILKVHDGAYIF